jgi:hypothetical protein
LEIIDTEKLEGRMYIAVKIIPPTDRRFDLVFKKVRGTGNDIPVV